MNHGTERGPSLWRYESAGHGYARFNGRQDWFGPFDGPAAHAELAAFKTRWEASGRRLPEERAEVGSMMVADLVARYLEHAEVYYREPDGTPTHEIVPTSRVARRTTHS